LPSRAPYTAKVESPKKKLGLKIVSRKKADTGRKRGIPPIEAIEIEGIEDQEDWEKNFNPEEDPSIIKKLEWGNEDDFGKKELTPEEQEFLKNLMYLQDFKYAKKAFDAFDYDKSGSLEQ